MNIATIMVPTDLTPHSSIVLPYAAALAEHHEARLVLAHVARTPVDKAVAETALAALAGTAGLRRCERQVVIGHSPAAPLSSLAQTCHADLMVVASHARRGLARALVGSTTAGLIRSAPCPVLVLKHPGVLLEPGPPSTVRYDDGSRILRQSAPIAEDQDRTLLDEDRPPRPFADLHLRTILVGMDFGTAAASALRAARSLAQSYNARLWLLHAVSDALSPKEREQAAESAFNRLGSMARDCPGSTLTVVSGPADELIADAAEHHGVNLVVMGTGNHQGLWRYLLGSTAEAVMQRVRVPLLVVRDGVSVESTDRPMTVAAALR